MRCTLCPAAWVLDWNPTRTSILASRGRNSEQPCSGAGPPPLLPGFSVLGMCSITWTDTQWQVRSDFCFFCKSNQRLGQLGSQLVLSLSTLFQTAYPFRQAGAGVDSRQVILCHQKVDFYKPEPRWQNIDSEPLGTHMCLLLHLIVDRKPKCIVWDEF